jgi:predicted DCC family thiol-disulfide oxidoreductase YuxK
MNGPALTLYYDGNCPFCLAGMEDLARHDKRHCLAFVDIALPGFDPAHLGAGMAELNLEIYSLTGQGKVLVGVDSLLAAYTLTGRGWLVWPLRVPILRAVLSALYRAFARNRYTMSRLLGYKARPRCESGLCFHGNPFFKNGKQP